MNHLTAGECSGRGESEEPPHLGAGEGEGSAGGGAGVPQHPAGQGEGGGAETHAHHQRPELRACQRSPTGIALISASLVCCD